MNATAIHVVSSVDVSCVDILWMTCTVQDHVYGLSIKQILSFEVHAHVLIMPACTEKSSRRRRPGGGINFHPNLISQLFSRYLFLTLSLLFTGEVAWNDKSIVPI